MMQHGSNHRPPQQIDPAWHIGIIYTMYYEEIVSSLLVGAMRTLQSLGLPEENISTHPVMGSFEIPVIGAELADSDCVDALIGLGVIVQGETAHADHIAREVARGIMDVQVRYRKPFAFEVLHVATIEQARARAAAGANRGEEAAYAVLHSLAELKRIQS